MSLFPAHSKNERGLLIGSGEFHLEEAKTLLRQRLNVAMVEFTIVEIDLSLIETNVLSLFSSPGISNVRPGTFADIEKRTVRSVGCVSDPARIVKAGEGARQYLVAPMP